MIEVPIEHPVPDKMIPRVPETIDLSTKILVGVSNTLIHPVGIGPLDLPKAPKTDGPTQDLPKKGGRGKKGLVKLTWRFFAWFPDSEVG